MCNARMLGLMRTRFKEVDSRSDRGGSASCWAPVHWSAQSMEDGIMLMKKTTFGGVMYNHDSWNQYWEGPLERTNGNLGTVTTQSLVATGDYGLTKRINLLGEVPYIWTNASQGVLHGQSGVQDLTLAAKYNFINFPVGQSWVDPRHRRHSGFASADELFARPAAPFDWTAQQASRPADHGQRAIKQRPVRECIRGVHVSRSCEAGQVFLLHQRATLSFQPGCDAEPHELPTLAWATTTTTAS